jgi:cytochrome b561
MTPTFARLGVSNEPGAAQPGWLGRLACAAHVTTYTLTAVITLAGLALTTGWRPAPWHTVIGLTVSAVSHYIADRRRPGCDDNPSLGTGAYALDQSWHVGWLFFAALWIAGGHP